MEIIIPIIAAVAGIAAGAGGIFAYNKKNEKGEWYKELIFVDSYVRHGYHRNALMEEE